MIDSNVEAVLVKVSAMGLEPGKHLGKSISQLREYFKKLVIVFLCIKIMIIKNLSFLILLL